MKFDNEDGWGYACTRAEMDNPGAKPKVARYRCKRCGMTTKNLRTMKRHVRWRWLLDWGNGGGIVKRMKYAYLSAISFMISGTIGADGSGWIGWWSIPSFLAIILGFLFMDAYASKYND